MSNKNIIERFYHHEKNSPNKPYLHQPIGDRWETYTWGEVGTQVRKMANYLLQQNLPPKSKIGLVSKNCREWIIADLAIIMSGHISVPFFPTLTGDQINEVLQIGDVSLLFAGKIEVWDDMGQGVPDDMPIIRFPTYPGNDRIHRGIDWSEIMENTEALAGEPIPKMDDIWTIIFTSGTTGTPKGVMHDYKNIYNLLELTAEDNAFKLSKTGENRFFSYLPLNHIAERTLEVASVDFGGEVFFTESLSTFADNLRHASPTIFFAVPRIWTKFMQGILHKMPQKKLSRMLKIPIVSSMVKKKIAKGLGIHNARVNISGAAPIAQTTKDWFASIGLPITEAYGMTENFATCTSLRDYENKPGSVGKPRGDIKVKIDPDSNEILMKANFNMLGYYKDPEKTADTIKDGWLHTGDQGRLDDDGFLYITGRVKDTFKTSKGEFITPAEIEDKFAINNDIEQMCLLGLGMPQPVMVVAPSEIGLSKSKNELKASLESSVKEINAELPRYKQVSALIIPSEPFSIEQGTLTPTLKVKRNKVHEIYKDRLLMYCEGDDCVVWE